MACAGQHSTIADLRCYLERAGQHGREPGAVLPFWVDAIDAHLPQGGLARGHLHEAIEGGGASQYAGIATLFMAGIIARMKGPVLWCLRGRDLFAPALARVGLHPDRVIFCETWKGRDVLPAMEEGLKCAGLVAVVGEVSKLSLNASRRLQLCAGESGVTALIIRRWHSEQQASSEPNAAATRWRIAPAPSPASNFDGLPRQLWQLDFLRVRSGEPHSWVLEGCDATGHLALPAALAERSAAADKGLNDEPLPLFAAADDRAGQLKPELIEPQVSLPSMRWGAKWSRITAAQASACAAIRSRFCAHNSKLGAISRAKHCARPETEAGFRLRAWCWCGKCRARPRCHVHHARRRIRQRQSDCVAERLRAKPPRYPRRLDARLRRSGAARKRRHASDRRAGERSIHSFFAPLSTDNGGLVASLVGRGNSEPENHARSTV
jgi:protein ImuA